jgi:hypothetical protein
MREVSEHAFEGGSTQLHLYHFLRRKRYFWKPRWFLIKNSMATTSDAEEVYWLSSV